MTRFLRSVMVWTAGLLYLSRLCIGAAPCTLSRETVPAITEEDVTLTVSQPGRYAIQVNSATGALFRLCDPITGPGPVNGVAGTCDGRLDIFLDEGDYLLRIKGSGQADDSVRISAMPFTKVQQDSISLPGLEPLEVTLADREIRDYWFTLRETQPVYIDAAGRALADMRIHLNGTWLTGDEPERTVIESVTGHPMNRCRLLVTCPPGTHKVSVYGGSPAIWSSGRDTYPLFIRSGINSLPPAGAITRSLSQFGDDLFLTQNGPDYFVMDSLTVGVGFAVEEIEPYQTMELSNPFISRIVNRNYPWIHRQFYDNESRKLVRISGPAGAIFNLRWFAGNLNNTPYSTTLDGAKSVTFFAGGNPRDLPDLNALIIEETRQEPTTQTILADSSLEVGPQNPLYKQFNAFGSVSLFISVKQDGEYLFSSRGIPARFILEPFFLRAPPQYVAPLPQTFPATISAGAKLYRLTILPDKQGSIELAVTGTGDTLDWNRVRAGSAEEPDGAVRFRDLTFSRQKQYHFVTNRVGEKTGFYVGEYLSPDQALPSECQPDRAKQAGSDEPEDTGSPLLPEDRITLLKEPGIPVRVVLKITREGVYDLTAKSIFQCTITLRSGQRTDLGGFIPGSTGNTSILRQYLTPGDYRVEIDSAGEGSGTVMLSCAALDNIHVGETAPGEICRSELQPDWYASTDFIVPEKDKYFVAAQTLEAPLMLRLQDANGWPVAIRTGDLQDLELEMGRYRIILIASPTTRAARLSVGRMEGDAPVTGEGPHLLDLAKPPNALWEGREEDRAGDEWLFNLQTETTLTVSLTNGMEGRIVDVAGEETIAIVPEKSFWTGEMLPGEWGIIVSPPFPDNLRPYRISVTADPLIDGTSTRMKVPGRTNLRIGGLDLCFAIISVTGNADTRAILMDSESHVISSSDDVSGDWNPGFALWMLPGDYSLFVEPVGQHEDMEVEVCLSLPPIRSVEWPESGSLTVTPQKEIAFVDTASTATGSITALQISSGGLSGISGIPIPGIQCCQDAGYEPGRNHVFLSAPGAPNGCLVWSIDGRSDPITLHKIHIPLNSDRETDKRKTPLAWTESPINDITAAVSGVDVSSPGSFRITNAGPACYTLLSVDDQPFSALPAGDSTWAIRNRFILGCVRTKDGRLPTITTERVVLNSSSSDVEWTASTGMELWVDLDLSDAGKVVLVIRGDADVVETCIDKIWSAAPNLSRDETDSAGWYRMLPDNRIRKIGLRVPADAAFGPCRLTASLATFDSHSVRISNAPAGSIRLPAHGMAIVEGHSLKAWASGSDVLIHSSDGDDSRTSFFNMSFGEVAVAWSSSDRPVTLPDEAVVQNGAGPAVFLGPGLNQRFVFKVTHPLQAGISIQSTTGRIRGLLLDRNGVQIATGLLINESLDPGDYTLLVQNPMDGAPSMVTPFFVLETPDHLMRFGKEE
ncbi:hypothetical protein JW823_02985 [bacterium]|nr:hypothetical protein [candidate division CSSED10-310 bacterium]